MYDGNGEYRKDGLITNNMARVKRFMYEVGAKQFFPNRAVKRCVNAELDHTPVRPTSSRSPLTQRGYYMVKNRRIYE